MADISKINVNNTEYNVKDSTARSKQIIEGQASGSIATFSDGGDNIPMKSCEVAIVAQQARGAPSPTNPLSISGFSSVNAVDFGINIWDEQWELGQYDINTGGKATNNNAIRSKNFIPIKAGINQKVYFHIPNGVRLYFYDKDKNYLGSSYSFVVNESQEITFTLASAYYFTFYTGNTTTYGNNISINYPSTDTQYHAYTGTTTPVSLGQTIYGGTAEIVGGNGIKKFVAVDLGDLTWTSTTQDRWISTGIISTVKPSSSSSSKINGLCSHYEILSADEVYLQNTGIAVATNGVISIYDSSLVGKTEAQVKTALTGYQLLYELATPTTFTFTGANILTLSGVNNVYADSGDVDLVYFNENADEIAELIRLYQHKYSTEEHIVGTWIDGKPLYEKTVECGAIPNAESTGGAWIIGISETAHNISNLDKIVYINGIGVGNDCYYPLPCNSNAYEDVDVYVESGYILIVTDSTQWRGKTTNSYVTLRYTKT